LNVCVKVDDYSRGHKKTQTDGRVGGKWELVCSVDTHNSMTDIRRNPYLLNFVSRMTVNFEMSSLLLIIFFIKFNGKKRR
jgi:hypothetical protein